MNKNYKKIPLDIMQNHGIIYLIRNVLPVDCHFWLNGYNEVPA